jgi:hypothetical protein
VLSWRGPEEVCAALFAARLQTCSGRNRDPEGAPQAKQNDAVLQGAGKAPKRDPEQRTGYEAEGSHWTESDSCNSVADVRPNRSRLSNGIRST